MSLQIRTSASRFCMVAACIATGLLAAPVAASAAPSWDLSISNLGAANFTPGAQGDLTDGPGYVLHATNSGDQPTSGVYQITDTLPGRLSAADVTAEDSLGNPLSCGVIAQVVTCIGSAAIAPDGAAEVRIAVDIAAGESYESVENLVTVSGGGGGEASAGVQTLISTGKPAWKLTAAPLPSNFAPGAVGDGSGPLLLTTAYNVGAASTVGPVTVETEFPPGLTVIDTNGFTNGAIQSSDCDEAAQTATCAFTFSGGLAPGQWVSVGFTVSVAPGLEEGLLQASTEVTSDGTATRTASTPIQIGDAPIPFDFLSGPGGFTAPLTDPDGLASTQAGSHPTRLTVDLAFPTEKVAATENLQASLSGTEHPRQIGTQLPQGVVANPRATPLCTEAQLTQQPAACPAASQIGTATVTTMILGAVTYTSPLFNMVPPPGSPASFGFDVAGVGVFAHILGGVRSDDRYQLFASSDDLLARGVNPVLGVQVQLWGDPSSPIHDRVREADVEPSDSPFLSMPSQCTGKPLTSIASARSWEHPEVVKTRAYESADLAGNPVSVEGCEQLEFAPTLRARPTTDAADSPTGLDVSLEVPQSDSHDLLSTAHLRRAVVTLPPGLVVNPASANGLAGCSSDQVGLTSAVGETPIRFDGEPAACPDAARIGEVKVDTPLLGHPLPGSVYVATPDDNPFGSLLAIYIAIDDPKSGVVAKLAGHVGADPRTGQLTTTFDENPQLPFNEFKLDFFPGPGAALRTPATCGSYSTTSQMTPWSAPASGPPASPSDTYSITRSPDAGGCATSPGEQPHAPAFDAGTLSPIAGAHSPFVLHLARQDGSQQFSSFSLKPPPGLLAKLAGTAICPDSALAAAAAKSGREEQASPSCPAASRVGTVTVAAGAGPAPYYTTGTAYLTGPYKGAPISGAVITPAAAGPYDLGTVVVKTAFHLDSRTGEITALADPIPQILEGIPLDVRSIEVALDKPDFTLNPTNCDPMAVSGEIFSTIGTLAALRSPFQLAECERLAFKPKLALKLKGATRRATNPRLIATLTARPGEANIARAQVKLPSAAFLDNSHIKTICTRVQFAADTCPAGSVYGKASATTPLLDYALSGNVILRSSSNQLPDLVVDLRGPAHQPLRVELAGRTDSVKGALRNTFDLAPDAPVSSFRLELFGGKRGLVELSRNLCKGRYRATVKLDAHNGKVYDTAPLVGNSCKKKRQKRGGGKKGSKRRNGRGGR
jgi:hypothetical protein